MSKFEHLWPPRVLAGRILQHRYQVAILFGLFGFYLLNGVGALDIHFRPAPDLDFHPDILSSVAGTILQQPIESASLNLWLMLGTGLFLSIVLPLAPPVPASLATVLISLPHAYLYATALPGARLILPMEYSLLIILILFAMNALMVYFVETQSRQRILAVFGQYVPPAVVSQIARNPRALDLRGESRRMTVFFCDLQDFTSVAEQLNPRQLTLLLNEYFDGMTGILFDHGATIDKYIGDSIMAFWGAPLPQEDHAERAVLAALDMQRAIGRLSAGFLQRGWPGPSMGIGINTGLMNVGNMGSRHRITYTVIGDAVNIAARLESLTRRYRVPILVSEATRDACPGIAFRDIDRVKVKGKQRHTRICQPLCRRGELTPEREARLARHDQAVSAWLQRDHARARRLFSELRDADPEDGYYQAMLDSARGKAPELTGSDPFK